MKSNINETLHQIIFLNEDEQFYKAYFKASKSPKHLKKFLAGVNRDDAIKRHLVIPEILPEIISFEMRDTEYFSDQDSRSVFISRHNRYTPAFMHKHDFFEMIYVYSGICTQNIGLKRIHFREGDIIFIAPGVYHTMEVFDDETIVFNILLRKSTFYQMFTPLMKRNDILSEFFSEGLYHSHQIEYVIFHMDGVQRELGRNYMLQLYKEHIFHDQYSDQILVGMLTMLSATIMRRCENNMETSYTKSHQSLPENFMVMNYMQEHLEEVTLKDVADHFGFSLSYCSRLIKSTTGQGFNEWKRTIRMRRAEHMLLNTKKSVCDIGAEIGYVNPETFIRAFKKSMHITPAQYRKQAKKL